MSSIGDSGYIPPVYHTQGGNQDETSHVNQAQQMLFMLKMLLAVVNTEGGDTTEINSLIKTFTNGIKNSPNILDIKEMAKEVNQISSSLDLRYHLDFPQLNPQDPPGRPGFQFLTYTIGMARFLEKTSPNDPKLENWINNANQFLSQDQWNANDAYKEATNFLNMAKSFGFSTPLPYNFFGNASPS